MRRRLLPFLEPERGCVVLDQPQRLARTTRVGTSRIVARFTRCAWPPRHRRAPPNWVMAPMRDSEIVEAPHEPPKVGGERLCRAHSADAGGASEASISVSVVEGEDAHFVRLASLESRLHGVSPHQIHWFMAPIHVHFLEVSASHEPGRGCVVLDQPQRLGRTTRVGTSPHRRPIHALRLASEAQARSAQLVHGSDARFRIRGGSP